MRATLRYGGAATLLVAAAVGLLWPVLDPPGRSGVIMAAAVALPIQVAAFGLLVRGGGGGTSAFLLAWVGGTLVRMATVLGAGLFLVLTRGFAPAPTLLGLAGFFFGLLLLEALFWGLGAVGGEHQRDLSATTS